MADPRTVLVTGATGRVGGQVAAQLAAAGVRTRALARDPVRASATLDAAIEVRGGDLAEPATLAGALDGVGAVFLVFPSVVADGAARSLVAALAHRDRRIVYLSAHGVPEQPSPDARPDGSILGSHAHLEGLIAASAAGYTFLRASGFAANTLAWAGQLRRSDVLRWFHPRARRALVHEADLAAAGVRALTGEGHNRAAYHLTGPQQLTQAEQLQTIGAVLGRSLRFEEVSTRQAGELFPGLPAEVATSIAAGHAAFVDHPEPVTATVEQLTGRPALPFARWVTDHAADFAKRE